jgi:hypothetical protein
MLARNPASSMSPRCRLLPRVLLTLAAFTAVFVLPGCGDDHAKTKEFKTVAEYFPVKLGDRTVRLQLAVKPLEMQTGLMDRPKLGADDGMIFVYPQPQEMSFWMRNTLIPLDIGYFDAKGVLQEVWQMYPHDEREKKSRGSALQFAVEMNQNWYRDHGVKPGTKLELAALKQALAARGFEPRRFGIE